MENPVLSNTSDPVFLMNPPLTLATTIANNRTMSLLTEEERKIDPEPAMHQWLSLYRRLSRDALVYLLPSNEKLQDVCFVSNLGVVLNHSRTPRVVISNFRAKGRQGESAVGQTFFKKLGYEVTVAPGYFEGEADLKHLSGSVYFGGYGLRSTKEAHSWLQKQFDATVISLRLEDPHLFHLDCVLFVLDEETILLCTSVCEKKVLREIEKHCRIIDVPVELAYRGITNSVRCRTSVFTESRTDSLSVGDENYAVEKQKRRFMENLAARCDFDLSFFDLNEFHKSGAMLSCLVMPVCNTRNTTHSNKLG